MKREKRDTSKHLFICTNVKADGECCGVKKSTELVNLLKIKLRENNKYDKIKVNSSSCLGPCSRGISAVLFPGNELLTELNVEDVDHLYDLLNN